MFFLAPIFLLIFFRSAKFAYFFLEIYTIIILILDRRLQIFFKQIICNFFLLAHNESQNCTFFILLAYF